MQEARRARRISLRRNGFLNILDHIFPFVALDISKGGASISVRASIPVETRCTLVFEDNKTLIFPVIVMRSNNNICGLLFSDLTSAHIKYLDAILL